MEVTEQIDKSRVAQLQSELPKVVFRLPIADDGTAIHKLIGQCAPLDPNSLYCNLLQATHFADTSVLAECDGELAAFLSAYVKPAEPEVLFVWQVAVAEKWRGHGFARSMLMALFQRPSLKSVQFLETSITPSNQASVSLFRRFANERQAALTTAILFSKAGHFAGNHDDEVLFRIGPFGAEHKLSQ